MTKAATYLKINVWLFLIGIGIAGYLIHHHYELLNGDGGFGSFCSINATIDCDAVNSSAYSEVLGIPLATWGLSYYLFALVLSFTGWRNSFARRESVLVLYPFTIGAAVAALSTLGVTVLILKKFCIMCTSMQLVQLATLVTTWLAVRDVTTQSSLGHEIRQMRGNRVMTFLAVGVACFGLTHLVSSQFKQEDPFDGDAFITALRSEPVMPVEIGDSPKMGFIGDNPPLRLIEFADFECPGCRVAARHMHRLTEAYADRVQLVFRSFPLNSDCNPHVPRRMHLNACLAAKAAHCAHKQGRFKPMYEALFSNQKEISPENVLLWARKIALHESEFESCLASEETMTAIQKDADHGSSLGLQSTPTFFANGRRVEGAIDERRLKLLLRELAK